MTITAGTVSVSDDGNYSGSGFALQLFETRKIALEQTSPSPLAIPTVGQTDGGYSPQFPATAEDVTRAKERRLSILRPMATDSAQIATLVSYLRDSIDTERVAARFEEDFTGAFTTLPDVNAGTMIGNVCFQQTGGSTWLVIETPLDANHPGICRFSLPASAGAVVGFIADPHYSRGDDYQYQVFRTGSTFANLNLRVGEFNGGVGSEPPDGVYLWQQPGTSTFQFKTSTGSSRTAGTTFSLTTNTWYGLEIAWNQDRTAVTCTLYTDSGAIVRTQTFTTTLPSASVQLFARALCTTSVATAVAQAFDADLVRSRHGSSSNPLGRWVPALDI